MCWRTSRYVITVIAAQNLLSACFVLTTTRKVDYRYKGPVGAPGQSYEKEVGQYATEFHAGIKDNQVDVTIMRHQKCQTYHDVPTQQYVEHQRTVVWRNPVFGNKDGDATSAIATDLIAGPLFAGVGAALMLLSSNWSDEPNVDESGEETTSDRDYALYGGGSLAVLGVLQLAGILYRMFSAIDTTDEAGEVFPDTKKVGTSHHKCNPYYFEGKLVAVFVGPLSLSGKFNSKGQATVALPKMEELIAAGYKRPILEAIYTDDDSIRAEINLLDIPAFRDNVLEYIRKHYKQALAKQDKTIRTKCWRLQKELYPAIEETCLYADQVHEQWEEGKNQARKKDSEDRIMSRTEALKKKFLPFKSFLLTCQKKKKFSKKETTMAEDIYAKVSLPKSGYPEEDKEAYRRALRDLFPKLIQEEGIDDPVFDCQKHIAQIQAEAEKKKAEAFFKKITAAARRFIGQAVRWLRTPAGKNAWQMACKRVCDDNSINAHRAAVCFRHCVEEREEKARDCLEHPLNWRPVLGSYHGAPVSTPYSSQEINSYDCYKITYIYAAATGKTKELERIRDDLDKIKVVR